MTEPKRDASGKWLPGKSGNPKGGNQRRSLEALVERYLDAKPEGSPLQRREQLAEKWAEAMLDGDMRALQLYLARKWPEVHKVQTDVRTWEPPPWPKTNEAYTAELREVLEEARADVVH